MDNVRIVGAGAADASLSLARLKDMQEEMGRRRWRLVSDVAQVAANFLRCHPRVGEVRYPGLKADLLFGQAATTLQGGFGPVVLYRTAGEWHELICDSCDPRELCLALERDLEGISGKG